MNIRIEYSTDFSDSKLTFDNGQYAVSIEGLSDTDLENLATLIAKYLGAVERYGARQTVST